MRPDDKVIILADNNNNKYSYKKIRVRYSGYITRTYLVVN